MKRLYHSAIFYPEEPDELSAMTSGIEEHIEKASALILPHGDLRKLYRLYDSAFGYIPKNTKRVIILTPIHSELLTEDEDEIALESSCGILETFYGDISIKSLGLKVNEAYAEEESAPEIILPYIKKYLPEAAAAVVYARIGNADESKKLSHMIRKWQDADTFFIISSNLSGRIRKEEVEKVRIDAANYITDGYHLLDVRNKHMADMCASGIIDSMNRVSNKPWHLIAFSENDTITAHGAFYKE